MKEFMFDKDIALDSLLNIESALKRPARSWLKEPAGRFVSGMFQENT